MKRLWPLAIATFISDFGSSLTLAALPVLFLLHGRKDGIGIYNGFDSVGALVGSIWAMAFLDRFRRNRVAALSDLIRAAVLLPLIFTDHITIPMIGVYAVVQAIFGATTASAVQAWIAEHPMSELELKRANSMIEVASRIAAAAGPAVGVVILAVGTVKSILVIDAGTFVAGAILVWGLQSKKPELRSGSFIDEVREGVAYSFGNRSILKWISVSMIHGIGFAIMNTLYVGILSDQIGATDEKITFFQTAYFAGSFLGSLVSLTSRQSPRAALVWGSCLLAVVMWASPFVANYWIFFALGAVQTFGRLLTVIGTRTLVQQSANPAYIGRVMAFRSAAIDVANIVIYAGAVWGAAHIPVEQFLMFSGVCFAATIFLSGVPRGRPQKQ
jgi:DHA3 family macrolide efflux protein-like MFS transporter